MTPPTRTPATEADVEPLDDDGYPTDAFLDYLRTYPINGRAACKALLSAVRPAWQYADCGYWTENGDDYGISTGGWSGNESIIAALEQNFLFWSLCWWSSRRGGHYAFKLSAVLGTNGGGDAKP